MGEQEETQGDKIHPWVYYIGPATSTGSQIGLFFTAFCKDCRQYFVERIQSPVDGKGTLYPSTLPRTGCKGVSLGF